MEKFSNSSLSLYTCLIKRSVLSRRALNAGSYNVKTTSGGLLKIIKCFYILYLLLTTQLMLGHKDHQWWAVEDYQMFLHSLSSVDY